jgi:N-acetylmuramoyl-L-alanine amidase
VTVRKPPFLTGPIYKVPTHGTRTPKYFVIHVTEGGGTCESLSAYFRNSGGGLGVTFTNEPSGRCSQNVSLDATTWHVKKHNSECVGIEQIGWANKSRLWWTTLGRRQLYSTAWIVAWACEQYGIPIIQASDNRRKWTHPAGVTQHMWVPDNDHDDCGPGYPFDLVLKYATKWTRTGSPAPITLRLLGVK